MPPLADTRRQKLTLSFAMCTDNGEADLQEQFASVLRQTLPPNELAASDNGSSDQTIGIIESFAERAPFFPVHLFRNEVNMGVGSTPAGRLYR